KSQNPTQAEEPGLPWARWFEEKESEGFSQLHPPPLAGYPVEVSMGRGFCGATGSGTSIAASAGAQGDFVSSFVWNFVGMVLREALLEGRRSMYRRNPVLMQA
ncbi:MAG: hypothetical protein JJU29_14095, partial [Verrucomicrobia bacterium]|nr:hypothetical protein [Verrucomicrobiota bacterium]